MAKARRKYKKLTLCKPCWELKYCPYGVVVETMPLLSPANSGGRHSSDETWEQLYKRSIKTLKTTNFKSDDDVWRNMFFVLFADTNKWNYVKDYNPSDVSCNIFGHVCPVFFYGREGWSETRELRVHGRHIPRDIMMKVVRRDDYRCRKCGQHVEDRDIEFDHVIPHAKGGPTSVENIRLLCRPCNRKKSDSLPELLE
jgi:hypothetical protein